MVEQVFHMAVTDERVVEKIVQDENLHYLHMVLSREDGLPKHFSNATVYMTVVRGTLSIGLNDGEFRLYEAGHVLKIPYMTKMNIQNQHEAALELIVVKAPPPKA